MYQNWKLILNCQMFYCFTVSNKCSFGERLLSKTLKFDQPQFWMLNSCIEPFVSSLSFCGCRFHARQIIIYKPILMKNWTDMQFLLAFFNKRMLLRRNTSSLHLSQMLLLLLLARRSPGWNWASIWPHPWSGSRLKKRHLEVWTLFHLRT